MIERTTADLPQRGRLLVVSHACVLPVNQHVYSRLAELGWDVTLVVPKNWSHEYQTDTFESRALPELEGAFIRLPVLLAGRPQRHVYRVSAARFVRRLRPQVAFFEEETFSLPAAQWAIGAFRTATPFGVQAAENLDRRLPWPALGARSWTLQKASFVAARSPKAGELARQWGATGEIAHVPHALAPWQPRRRQESRPFTVGFAGRLVPQKGLLDLALAVARLDGPVRLLVVGDGPMRAEIEALRIPNGSVELRTDVGHGEMPYAYADMDVLVLPSRTTTRWAEQFGRVLVEALWCGVPVIGSSSGEIPWVIDATGGGLVFTEGDVGALTMSLARLQANPRERQELAARGGETARRRFSADASANELDAALRAAVERSSHPLRSKAGGPASPVPGEVIQP